LIFNADGGPGSCKLLNPDVKEGIAHIFIHNCRIESLAT
jgi:hypothetical protein